MTTVIENATKFWEEDLDQFEGRHLHGRNICSLPPGKGDNRVPNQGTVLVNSPVNIDAVIGEPDMSMRVGAALLTARRTISKFFS